MDMNTTFQRVYSRNNTDWKYVEKNGRLTLSATGGVKQRCAHVLKVMKDYKTRKPIAQGFIHVELKHMYTLDDVIYALTKMEKIGVVRKASTGWMLTAKGHRVIQASQEA